MSFCLKTDETKNMKERFFWVTCRLNPVHAYSMCVCVLDDG